MAHSWCCSYHCYHVAGGSVLIQKHNLASLDNKFVGISGSISKSIFRMITGDANYTGKFHQTPFASVLYVGAVSRLWNCIFVGVLVVVTALGISTKSLFPHSFVWAQPQQHISQQIYLFGMVFYYSLHYL